MKSAFVIGSGIAGLSIAEILSRNGYKVTILESQDKIGGEASLATQKWYHTGWLYAPLLNKAAMMGCYKALQLYEKIYSGIFSDKSINLKLRSTGVTYSNSENDWFSDERIFFLYAISTYEMSQLSKIFWPFYLRFVPFRRLRNLNYDITPLNEIDENMKGLMNRWEGNNNGYQRYKVIRSNDAKIDTGKVTKSLVSQLSHRTEIITNAKPEFRESKGQTEVKLDGIYFKPDIVILASGKAVPDNLREIGSKKLASKIESIKSPILVLKNEISYPDFIRFTPFVEHTINHIKFSLSDGNRVSTVGSYYSFPTDSEVDISYYENKMCDKIGLSKSDVLGSYFGIKTEYLDGAERRYNHALEKVNSNTFIALAGKFSQFPLLVYDFSTKMGLSFDQRKSFEKITISSDIFNETYPAQLVNNRKGFIKS